MEIIKYIHKFCICGVPQIEQREVKKIILILVITWADAEWGCSLILEFSVIEII